MIKFHTQPSNEIQASTQLLSQLSFAIACGQYAPGYRLPSTRQLAMQTGLHRNTISRVYRQLEDLGLVETRAGSGIYVTASQQAIRSAIETAELGDQAAAYQLLRKGLDQLLQSGCSLGQARELLVAEIEWRLRAQARILVSVPAHDLGGGELMAQELQQALAMNVQVVPFDQLEAILNHHQSATIVTHRYFLAQVEAILGSQPSRVIPVDLNNYESELQRIRELPADSYLGLVSLSSPILEVARILIHSMRGSDLLLVTATLEEQDRLHQLVRCCQTIITDGPSYALVKTLVRQAQPELAQRPSLIKAGNYISAQSIQRLQREFGSLTPTDP